MCLPSQTPQLQCLHIIGIELLPSAEKKLRAKFPNLSLCKVMNPNSENSHNSKLQ